MDMIEDMQAPVIPEEKLFFSSEEKAQIDTWISRYPTADGAIMRVLWLAQEKFGFLPPEVIRLSAAAIGIPYARAYGVATFYTQYFKKKKGRYVLDVCTCYTCQLCGGYDVLHYLEEKLSTTTGVTTDDGLFTIQEAECLGACGSAPVLQVTNGPYAMSLTREKIDALVDALREDRMPPFESVTLPQDLIELGENRRSDAEATLPYSPPPVAETLN
jgi:NADH-quinone oxidoreductase subunit E